jgi:hypothetical protein
MAACARIIEDWSAEGYGVSDGFRTRDLRIHNPAL